MTRAAPALALLAALLSAAPNPPAGGAGVAAQVQQIRLSASFHASGRLVKVDAQGKREAFQISIRVSSSPGVLLSEYEVTSPEPARMRISIETRGNSAAVLRIARGAAQTPRTLPFAEWAEPVLGSDLSFEDLIDDQYRWSRQSLAPKARYGARLCFVLKSEPGAAQRSHYASVTSWLDEKILHPVRLEKTPRSAGPPKEFLYYGLRQHDGLWSASQIEVRSPSRPGSTFLIITRGGTDKPRP